MELPFSCKKILLSMICSTKSGSQSAGGVTYKSCYLCQSFGKNETYLLNIFNKSPYPTLKNDVFNKSTSYGLK